MKGRFPPDLFVIVFGPVVVLSIAIGFDSLIFHAQQLRSSVIGYCVVVAGTLVVVGTLLLRGRRRH